MNYELAKKLKDAGFKQSGDSERYAMQPRPIEFVGILDGMSDPYVPTLSELIEACGDGFETLSRDSTTEKVVWICNNYCDPDAFKEKTFGWYEGSTPEEAVANLWLALNKK